MAAALVSAGHVTPVGTAAIAILGAALGHLVELWRTAPYLHHGRARDLRQVLSWYNASDRHGQTAHLQDEELDALVAYLKSL